MKNYGWDIKYGFYILGAFILAAPILLHEPFLALIAIALFLVCFGGNKINNYNSLSRWEKVQGELIQKDIGMYQVSSGASSYPDEYYFPLAYFSYSFEGENYKSNEYSYDRKSVWSTDKREIDAITEDLVLGNKVTVFVNPAQPEMAVLNITVSKQRKSHCYALIVSGLLLIVIGTFAWSYS